MKKIIFVILCIFISIISFSETIKTTNQIPEYIESIFETDDLKALFDKTSETLYSKTTFKKIIIENQLLFFSSAQAPYTNYPNEYLTNDLKIKSLENAYENSIINLQEGIEKFFDENPEEKTIIFQKLKESDNPLVKIFLTLDNLVELLARSAYIYEKRESIPLDSRSKTNENLSICLLCTPEMLFETIKTGNPFIVANDYSPPLQLLISEIKMLHSDGCRFIMLTEENKFAFVGFASAYVRKTDDPMLKAHYLENAAQISQMKAKYHLVEILNGNSNEWQKEIDEGFNQIFFDKWKAVIRDTNLESYIQSSILPPSIITKTYDSPSLKEKGYGWLYSICIFYPQTLEENIFSKEEIHLQSLIDEIVQSQK